MLPQTPTQPVPGPALLPFARWVGGKTALCDQIAALVPADTRRLVDPFIGAGSVFFALCRRMGGAPVPAVVGDTNADLIRAWQGVKLDPEGTIRVYDTLRSAEQSDAYYRSVRDAGPIRGSPAEEAGWFLYMNRAGFNGLWRTNKAGKLNVPWAQKTDLPDFADRVRGAHRAVSLTDIEWGDFRETLRTVREHDTIFADPPFADTYNSYGPLRFGDVERGALADILARVHSDRGANIIYVDSDTPNVRRLYNDLGFRVTTLLDRRSVSCDAETRGNIAILLATSFKVTLPETIAPTAAPRAPSRRGRFVEVFPPGAPRTPPVPPTPISEIDMAQLHGWRWSNPADAPEGKQGPLRTGEPEERFERDDHWAYLVEREGSWVIVHRGVDGDIATGQSDVAKAFAAYHPIHFGYIRTANSLFGGATLDVWTENAPIVALARIREHLAAVPERPAIVVPKTVKAPKPTAPKDPNPPTPDPESSMTAPATPHNIDVTHITTDLKGGVDIEVAHHTVLVAPNGGGKSKTLAAVGLVLREEAPEIGYRRGVRKGSEIGAAASPDGNTVAVRLEFTTGDKGTWKLEANGSGGWRNPTHRAPGFVTAHSAPVEDVMDAMRKGPEGTRAFFIPRLISSVAEEDITKRLPEALRPTYLSLRRADLPAVEALTQSLEAFRSFAKKAEDDLEVLLAARGQSEGALPVRPTEHQIAEARAKLALAQADVTKQRRWTVAMRLLLDGRTANAEAARTQQVVQAMQAQLDAYPTPNPVDPIVAPMQAVLRILGSDATPRRGCPCCGTVGDQQGPFAPAHYANRLAASDLYYSKENEAKKIADTARAGMQQQIAQAAGVAVNAKAQLDAIIRMWGSEFPNVTPADAPMVLGTPLTLAEVETAYTTAQGALHALEQAEAAHVAVAASGDEGVEIQRAEATKWRAMANACEAVSTSILESSVPALEAKIQQFLPDDMKVRLSLAPFRFGLDYAGRGGKRITSWGFSGAEGAVLLLAVAAACVPPDTRCVVLYPPEDFGWSPVELGRALRALDKIPYQIIIPSTVEPNYGRGPKGKGFQWQVVNLDFRGKIVSADLSTVVDVAGDSPEPPVDSAAAGPVVGEA